MANHKANGRKKNGGNGDGKNEEERDLFCRIRDE
jgi:hypothetical protein